MKYLMIRYLYFSSNKEIALGFDDNIFQLILSIFSFSKKIAFGFKHK